MPNKENAKKALRQAKKHALANQEITAAYRNTVKKVKKAISTSAADLGEQLRAAQKRLDKAAKTGVIKKNTARRKISRLMKKANKLAKK
ncbi:MAG: 30S ribosomal protein S20 [Candidatus Firestonebacteria bacterium RIFOXYA2_FULL_40_8]|nr:MAG: 30S ribosomal protein S20 [Candidatus Firestonebacteria bacterium RIFOXYA2_FULL_40_8]HLD31834.1 30S ribosomal protein S20 [Patescibacteria group bacterium]